MNIKGQGLSFTMVQGHSDSTFSNFFSLETAWPIEAKFHVDSPWDGRMKVSINILWNQKAHNIETWDAALITQVLSKLFKW